jgi:ribosomal protein S18 acetylase RimI-like enzyme
MNEIYIEQVREVTAELVEAMARLLPQLTTHHPAPSPRDLEQLLRSEASLLFVARWPAAQNRIVGTLTLVLYRLPSGLRARIEDVVVDEAYRGQGIGEALLRHALGIAARRGADGVALTSNPRRQAANRLYQRLGFARWETNTYFYRFTPAAESADRPQDDR